MPRLVGSGPLRMRPSPSRRLFVAVVVGAAAVAAIAGTVALGFAPNGRRASGCADERRPGLDPALEAIVPRSLEGRPPDRLDSARTCSATGLGALAARVTAVASAGGLWQLGPSTGVTLAVFRLPGPDRADRIADFYASGAAAAPKVAGLSTTHPVVDGRPATRLDYTDADFPQTIVVWAASDPELVDVVLAAGVPERVVQEAIAAFGARS